MSRVNDARREAEKALKLAEQKGQRAIANRLKLTIRMLIDVVVS